MKRKPRRTPAQARAEILDATEALLADRSFGELRVEDLMAATGMTRPNFYHYFRNLEAVAVDILARIEGEVMPDVQPWLQMPANPPPERALRHALRVSAETFVRHGVVLRAIYQAAQQYEVLAEHWREVLVDPFIDATTSLLQRQSRQGLLDVADPAGVARALLTMNVHTFMDRAAKQPPDDIDDIVDSLAVVWVRTLYCDIAG